jgi:hypothetical protein
VCVCVCVCARACRVQQRCTTTAAPYLPCAVKSRCLSTADVLQDTVVDGTERILPCVAVGQRVWQRAVDARDSANSKRNAEILLDVVPNRRLLPQSIPPTVANCCRTVHNRPVESRKVVFIEDACMDHARTHAFEQQLK